ncbi:MAG TPA: HNH endonuclease, partial [Gemmataceae bacterium]|nr:HNH endonuclease [Gemmataceae bacterium]
MKYTREVLQGAVQGSYSVAAVLRKLGLAEAGGTHAHISRRIKAFGIDTAHFLGQAANCGKRHRPPPRCAEVVLVLRQSGGRQKTYVLRRALLETGREYRCEGYGCAVGGEWLGRPLALHANHKNGNWLDDRP